MYTWSQLFKQLIRAYIAQKIEQSYAEGLKNAKRIMRGGL